MSQRRVLILDRPEGLESLLKEGLLVSGGANYEFCLEHQKKNALKELRIRGADIIIAGNTLEEGSASDFLEEAYRVYSPPIPAIVLALAEEADLVKDAFRVGTFDVLYRPFPLEQLNKKIAMACQMFKPRVRIESFESDDSDRSNYGDLVRLSREKGTSVVNLLAEQLAALKKTTDPR
jgi:DNA-binding NtrC family response regulator